MSEIDRIVDQFEREYRGDPWHGSPLTEILAGVDAEPAAGHPVPGAHSIWEIVLHVTAWKNEGRNRVRGGPASDPEDGDWPAVGVVTVERWQEARARLDESQTLLLEAIRRQPESHLFEPTNDPRNRPLGTGVTCYELLHGLVQHDVSHAGQIALLRKALR